MVKERFQRGEESPSLFLYKVLSHLSHLGLHLTVTGWCVFCSNTKGTNHWDVVRGVQRNSTVHFHFLQAACRDILEEYN